MIRVTEVDKSFGGHILFKGLSFAINPREKIGLVGRNGSGKTTLFQIMLGRMEPDAGTVAAPAGYRVGHLEQHIRFSCPTALAEACTSLAQEEADTTWKAEKLLAGLGFSPEDLCKPPQALSGGYQIRLTLAKLLLSEPDLLLLDEPNNYLDIVALRWLEGFLRAWKGELMLITHDRSFMDNIITHTVALHRQKARKIAGGTDKMYAQIAQDEEIYEKTRVNDEKKRRATELFIRRFRAKARLAGMVQSRIKCLEKLEKKDQLSAIETLEFSFNAAPFPAAQMMACHNISFSYAGGAPLIDKLSLTVGTRERVCVIGRNGRGKSTLIKLLSDELAPHEGTIKRHPVLKTACFSQTNVARLNDHKTVFEEIMAADPACLPQHARDIAGAMMFGGDAALKKVSVLSGGEKSRVLLGTLLVAPSHLLLLDEPTNHLDMESCDTLMEAIDAFEGSVVMVTHNELFLRRLATRLIVFDRGACRVFNGTYAEFLETVGWADEAMAAKPAPVCRTAVLSEKERKRRKAERVNEKSRALRPVEADMKSLESAIKISEVDLHTAMDQLEEASMNNDAARIAALAKKAHALKPAIDALYEKLFAATERYEKIVEHYIVLEKEEESGND